MENNSQEIEDILQAAQDVKIAEEKILEASLKEKNQRIRELEAEVRFLKDLLTNLRVPALAPVGREPTLRPKEIPRRWTLK